MNEKFRESLKTRFQSGPCKELCDFLAKNGIEDFVIFGGAIRDTYLEKYYDDIDICVSASKEKLASVLDQFEKQKAIEWKSNPFSTIFHREMNKLGGHRIHLDHHEFDIWSVYEMPVFKKLGKKPDINLVHETATCSCNCITYNPQNNVIKFIDGYFELLDQKVIKVFEHNWPDDWNKKSIPLRVNYLSYKIGARERVRHCMWKRLEDYFGTDKVKSNNIQFTITDKRGNIRFLETGCVYVRMRAE